MEVEVDWDKDKMQKKNFPSLPSNYVTLIQLKERKQRKLKEKEEQERQRMLQLRKIQEEEEERKRELQRQQEEEERKRELQRQQEEEERKRELQRQQEEEGRKRKLERQGLKQARNKTDRKPARHNSDHKPASHNGRKNWQRNDRAVEVWRAKPEESMAVVAVVVDIRKVSAQQEQSSDEAKENNKNTRQKRKKKMKPRAEEEEVKEKKKEKGTTDGESHALHVISEKENSPARRNGEPEGTRTEEVDRTAEIERKFGDFSIGKGNVRATRPNTGIYHGNRQHRPYGGVHREYNGSGSIGGSRTVRNPSGSGMVWVRKGEIGGVRNQSSIVEPKKLE